MSAASAWEIATKSRIGKLSDSVDLALRFDEVLAAELFESLPITSAHASRAGLLPGPHKDPFDRMLIAQSQAENLPILSDDSIFDTYKLRRSGPDFFILQFVHLLNGPESPFSVARGYHCQALQTLF